MIKILINLAGLCLTGFAIGLVAIAAFEVFVPLPHPVDCYTFIGRDGNERVFVLNKCEGSVRILVMPEGPPPTIPPKHNWPSY